MVSSKDTFGSTTYRSPRPNNKIRALHYFFTLTISLNTNMQSSEAEVIGKRLDDAAHGMVVLSKEEIQTLLDSYHPHARDPNAWWVIHSAAHQTSQCANLILETAWSDSKWRPMFTDPAYLDNYGKQVWERIRYARRHDAPIRIEISNECSSKN
jgi:hypothetical protein